MITVRRLFSDYGLYMAWLVAMIATLGSLYFSEIIGYDPCKLCWLQRIFMYPLAVILGIACFRGDRNIVRYAVALSIPGAIIAIYHYFVQKAPELVENLTICSASDPCGGDPLNWFGWITIPMLALIAFLLILICLFLYDRYSENEDEITLD